MYLPVVHGLCRCSLSQYLSRYRRYRPQTSAYSGITRNNPKLAIRKKERTPPDYNFLARSNAEFHHVRLSPKLPWPQSLEIGFMLPNRSAGAWRFWKLGYRTLSLSLRFPAVRSSIFPDRRQASKTRKFRSQSRY